jgi:glycosyltransferase involved in cell wall biosynthesis
MNKKKKLCLIIPDFNVGGMQRVMSELAWYYSSKENLTIHLILYGSKRSPFYPLPENASVHEPPKKLEGKSKIYYFFYIIPYLRKTIRAIEPDTILSFGEMWNNIVMIALLGLKYPIFLSDRCKPDKKFGIIHGNLRRLLYPRSKGIISQTEIAKSLYLKQFKHSNIVVVGNPIRSIDISSGDFEKENIVLSVGRMIPSKNFDLLIDAFLDINKENWNLVILGDDVPGYKVKFSLLKKVADNHACQKVFLPGHVSNVDHYYKTSKIFAFMSNSEGFPNVIGEAMSAGLPVISFDCVAGPSDMIINEKTGYLVPFGDQMTFRQKLEILMNNEELRNKMGLEGRKEIKRFSIENIGNQLLQVLLSIK